MPRLIEFKNAKAYEEWLREKAGRVRVVAVSTNKKWSLTTGFLGDNKSYSVTYEDIGRSEEDPERGPCPQCGESIPLAAQVCRFCGLDLIAHDEETLGSPED